VRLGEPLISLDMGRLLFAHLLGVSGQPILGGRGLGGATRRSLLQLVGGAAPTALLLLPGTFRCPGLDHRQLLPALVIDTAIRRRYALQHTGRRPGNGLSLCAR
jgi:hypothetical protein